MEIIAASTNYVDLDEIGKLFKDIESGKHGKWKKLSVSKGLVKDRAKGLDRSSLANFELPAFVVSMSVSSERMGITGSLPKGLQENFTGTGTFGEYPFTLAFFLEDGFRCVWRVSMVVGELETQLEVESAAGEIDESGYSPLVWLGIPHKVMDGEGGVPHVVLQSPEGLELGPIRRPESCSFPVGNELRQSLLTQVLAGIGSCAGGNSYVNVFLDVGDPFGKERNHREEATRLCSSVAECPLFEAVDYRLAFKGRLSWKEWEAQRREGKFQMQFLGRLDDKVDVGVVSSGDGYRLVARGADTEMPEVVAGQALTM